MLSKFSKSIASYVESEIALAKAARSVGDRLLEFRHLENAHVIGQESTYWHVTVHAFMFLWAVRNLMPKEVLGQFFRIIGAALMTPIGLIPNGNTGGSNVSLFKAVPVKPEHKVMISNAKAKI